MSSLQLVRFIQGYLQFHNIFFGLCCCWGASSGTLKFKKKRILMCHYFCQYFFHFNIKHRHFNDATVSKEIKLICCDSNVTFNRFLTFEIVFWKVNTTRLMSSPFFLSVFFFLFTSGFGFPRCEVKKNLLETRASDYRTSGRVGGRLIRLLPLWWEWKREVEKHAKEPANLSVWWYLLFLCVWNWLHLKTSTRLLTLLRG